MLIKRRCLPIEESNWRGWIGRRRTAGVAEIKTGARPAVVLLNKYWKHGLVFCITAVVLTGMFAAGTGFGILVERKDLTDKLVSFRPDRAAKNYLTSLMTSPDRLIIDIKHEDHEKLKSWRATALQRDQITADLKQYVPATLRYGDETYKAKLRLKGEWVDHVKTAKWSYRIKLSGDQSLLGMTCFGIQHPQVRKYSHEWLYHQALAREDVPRLRYQFLAVTVNGRDLGVYAVEEHFTKEMIEHNRRRQGVVLRINGDYRYHPYSDRDDVIDMEFDTGIRSEQSSPVVVYDEDKYALKPGLQAQVKAARNLLEGFRNGKLATSQVFDVDTLAHYFAVTELLGSLATIDDWSDKRFLYNPVSSRIEPIGLEGAHEDFEQIMGAKFNDVDSDPHDFHAQMFADPVFMRAYVNALNKVSAKDYIDRLFDDLGEELEHQLRILHREWPTHSFSRGEIYSNAERIRAYLNPLDGMIAYLHSRSPLTLELGAIQPLAVEVIDVVSGGRVLSKERWLLAGKPTKKRVRFQVKSLEANENTASEIKVRYRILGLDEVREVAVIDHKRVDEVSLTSSVIHQQPNIDDFDFLKLNEQEKTIEIGSGQVKIDKNLVLPPGYTWICNPGAVIDLVDGATILSRSPMDFRGDEENPIVVMSSDKSGQGLVVMEASAKSELKHVIFRDLSTPKQGDWELTGAVTFYRSPVSFDHCEFSDNESEDGLNIVSSEFQLQNSLFHGSTSDALDGDFCVGRISDCLFKGIGGDAIDFSGSQIEVEHVRITDVADKGLSVGEHSILVGNDIHVQRAGIGAASKDLSEADLSDVIVENCRFGCAVFQKKPEYGPATMTISDLTLRENQTNYLVEQLSTLIVEDDVIEPNKAGVRKMLYGESQ